MTDGIQGVAVVRHPFRGTGFGEGHDPGRVPQPRKGSLRRRQCHESHTRGREMPTDFRNGEFPRRGRDTLDGYLWLARVFDKARAARDETIYDYIYPCP